jgi:membrane protein YdbS with pleckstrin-like domain
VDQQPAPPGADGEEQALDPRVIPMRRIAWWIATAALGSVSFIGMLIAALTIDDMPGWLRVVLPLAWLGLVLLLAWHGYRWPALEYQHTRYRVDDQRFEIRRGVYFRVVISVPRSRVQHTDVSQGPVQRRYGLGTLVVHTAGTDHAMVQLAGLEHGTALRIREHLLPSEAGDAV